MESCYAIALLSPTSSSPPSPSSPFSPLPSPRAFSSASPRPFSSSPPCKSSPSYTDLDLSSSSSSMWNTPRPCPRLSSPPTFAFSKDSSHFSPQEFGFPSTVRGYAGTSTSQTEADEARFSSPRFGSRRRTHYDLLGVSPLASPKEIRSAYRKLALQHHPDVSPLHQLDTATKLFADINAAYAVLSDSEKRDQYDLQLALESPPSAFTSVKSPNSGSGSFHHVYSASPSPSPSPREYTHEATGRVYPSMNSFYREWRRAAHSNH